LSLTISFFGVLWIVKKVEHLWTDALSQHEKSPANSMTGLFFEVSA
jgi:hypothetical protein